MNAGCCIPKLIAHLLYLCSMCLMECLRLRGKFFDIEHSRVVVSESNGEKDRLTMLPANLVEPVKAVSFDVGEF